MHGVAAFAAAVATLAAHAPAPGAPHLRAALAPGPLAAAHLVVVRPSRRSAPLRTCSVQRREAGGVERKILPVACEQPPRSRLTLPAAPPIPAGALLGG